MSTDQTTDVSLMDSLDAFLGGEGYNQEADVKQNIELPTLFILNPSKPSDPHGLFIKASILPDDCKPDPKYFEEVSIPFEDEESPTKFREEKGYLATKCHLIIEAYDHDEKDFPKSSGTVVENKKTGKKVTKYSFYVVAQILQAFSFIKPFKIKFGGSTNAFRMENHIRNFDKYIVGEATAIKREIAKEKGIANVSGCSRNQFLLPLNLALEKVGSDSDSSWVAAVQDLEKEGLKLNGMRRFGTSTLQKFSAFPQGTALADKWKQLSKLFLPAHPGGIEKVRKIAEEMVIYKDSVKLVPYKNVLEANGGSGGGTYGDHFSNNPELTANADQVGKITELASLLKIDANREVQVLRGSSKLFGGTDASNVFSLTIAGANTMIACLSDKVKAGGIGSAAPVQQQTAPEPQKISVFDDDGDIPFTILLSLFTVSYFVLSGVNSWLS